MYISNKKEIYIVVSSTEYIVGRLHDLLEIQSLENKILNYSEKKFMNAIARDGKLIFLNRGKEKLTITEFKYSKTTKRGFFFVKI